MINKLHPLAPVTGKVRRLASRLRQKLIRPEPRRPLTAETLDLFAPDFVTNPFPHYEELRRSGSVHFLPRHDCWLVLGYDDVLSALSQPQSFSSRVEEWMAVDSVLLGADPPEHTAVRRVVGHHFSAHALETQSAFAEEAAERLLRPLADGKTCDVLREFTAPLSEDVAAHLIGFDEAALAAIRATQDTAKDLGQWLAALDSIIAGAAERMPIYGQLLRDGEGRLGHAQVRSLIRFLWIAGTTTTRRAIASSVLMLLRHPSMRPVIESDPALLSAFIEESLRLHPPEHSILRVATAEVELSGVKIPAGALVKLCVGAANRDPARFAEPAALLLHRTPNRHLSFGGGIHRCVGAALARVEMAAALRVLLRLAPRFSAVQPLETLRFTGFVNDTEQLLIER
ncbi:MAG: cytochrome P450 [Acidobacteria bacterium]|nr:cytochrome P450 [Acidobacteriota bacterium]